MCGILAVFYKKERQLTAIAPMLDKMKHRGKNQHTIKNYPKCDIGFVRLAITDINTPQPGKANGWETWINGEVYNYKDLGFSGSECEVLAQGFAKYGPDFVKKLNGMFVIVAVHGENVWVFRDRAGQKPLYYFHEKDTIVLASEIKPLLKHPLYKFGVNDCAVEQWRVFNNILTNETMFQDIWKMEAGTYWHLNTGKKTKYWEWNFEPQPMDYEEARREVRRLVEKAVKRMTPKEVDFGCLLSGGVDSGIIANLLPDCPVFTCGYDGGDERALAELTKKPKHYQIVFNRVTDFTDTILHLEDLRVGASWSNYGIFELASKFCTVIFDGSGSDELFAGYEWRYKSPDYWNVVNRTGIESEYCREVLADVFTVDTLENRFKFDAEHFLEAVLLVGDRMSMAHTVETRQPFLDNDLVDFALTLPNDFKKGKCILKDTFKDLLPVEVRLGRKQGWSSPDWFNGDGNQAKRWSESALNEWKKLFTFE